MEGGINAWNGLVATGAPDAGMAFFPDNGRPEQVIPLALSLEEGARLYYKGIEEMLTDTEHRELFRELGFAEVRHKAMLARLRMDMAPSSSGPEPSGEELNEVMEGGMRITEALDWARGKEIRDIIDYSIALETNSYDLYLKMERDTENAEAKKVFGALAEEEKKHLERFTGLLDRYV